MEKLEVTWIRATKIWWSLVWRSIVFGSIAGFIAGFVVGSIADMMGNDSLSSFYVQSAGMLIGVPVGILVVKIVLSKEFKDYRIVLLPSTESRIQKSLDKISRHEP